MLSVSTIPRIERIALQTAARRSCFTAARNLHFYGITFTTVGWHCRMTAPRGGLSDTITAVMLPNVRSSRIFPTAAFVPTERFCQSKFLFTPIFASLSFRIRDAWWSLARGMQTVSFVSTYYFIILRVELCLSNCQSCPSTISRITNRLSLHVHPSRFDWSAQGFLTTVITQAGVFVSGKAGTIVIVGRLVSRARYKTRDHYWRAFKINATGGGGERKKGTGTDLARVNHRNEG